MRQLNLIPIVHSPADLGKLRDVITTIKARLSSEEAVQVSAKAVERFWDELKLAIQEWQIDWKRALLYQDALPFTDQNKTELTNLIVNDLASQGSRNHQILQWLVAQGASLLGTESPELLLEEYQLIQQSFERGQAGNAVPTAGQHLADQQRNLLNKRDEFIAERIDKTLTADTVGIVFLGMLHSLEEKLPLDITTVYPFGKPESTAVN